MINILVLSAQTDLQSFLSDKQTGLKEIKVDYCQSIQSAMWRILENGGCQAAMAIDLHDHEIIIIKIPFTRTRKM